MKIIKPKIDEITVIVSASRGMPLIDRRIMSNGIFFGTVEDIAKNLGVTLKDTERGLSATAPKSRLQNFVEKLHFSGVLYREA